MVGFIVGNRSRSLLNVVRAGHGLADLANAGRRRCRAVLRSPSKKHESPRPAPRQPSRPAQPSPGAGLAVEEARIRRETEAEATAMMREVKAEAARMAREIEAETARIQAGAVREVAAAVSEQDDSEPVGSLAVSSGARTTCRRRTRTVT